MTSLIQFIEKADFEEDEEAQKWVDKFVACNNLGPQIIRKSERPKPVPLVHLQEKFHLLEKKD